MALLEEHHWRPSSVRAGKLQLDIVQKEISPLAGPWPRGTEDAMAAMPTAARATMLLRFYTACFDGNLDEVQRIVQGNPDLELNRVIHGARRLPRRSQRNSHVDVVRYLAGLGADMGDADPRRGDAGLIACIGQRKSSVFSARKWSTSRRRTRTGTRPLRSRRSTGRLDIAEIFSAARRNIALVNKKGTPSFLPVKKGISTSSKFLVRNGADARLGKNGISPFHAACYRVIGRRGRIWWSRSRSTRARSTGRGGRLWK